MRLSRIRFVKLLTKLPLFVRIFVSQQESDGSGSLGTKLKADKDIRLKEQKAWEFAQSSVKQVGMFAFMTYMSGNSVHIFSIMMTFNGLYQPLMAIYNSGKGE